MGDWSGRGNETVTPKVSKFVLVIKRAFDILFSSAAIVFELPVLLLVALIIKLESPGPVLYRQVRVGANGRLFEMLKFRTMRIDRVSEAEFLKKLQNERPNDDAVPKWSIRQDPRITPIGRLLRKTSLDELPQLWNVLIGDMSIVGPRPAFPFEIHQMTGSFPLRYTVRPGITGLWQVIRTYDTAMDEQKRSKADTEYVTRLSLGLDLKIIWRTLCSALEFRLPPN